jgi:RHS repeat-associated protein
VVEYLYDYQNRLVKRTQDKTETHFVHDDWQIILQFENKEIQPTHRYLWGTKQDELICDNNNWTLGDHLNTVRDIVKSDGTVVSHLEYNAFGKLISETKNDSFFVGYTGKLFDKVSNLQWNINRWYDSNVGKWINEDPIGFRGMDINLFRYLLNVTTINVDVNGLAPACCKSVAPTYFCCNMASGFEQNFVIWGMASPWDCVRDMLTDVWWIDVLVGTIEGSAVLTLDYILSKARSRFAGIYTLTELLAIESILTVAFRQCLSWRCKHPKLAPCSCITPGYIADTWQCTCAVGSMILNDAYKEFYQTNVPSGTNFVNDMQLRW